MIAMEFLRQIEETAVSIWAREDPYAYFVFLIVHAFGMAFLVGGRHRGVAAGAGCRGRSKASLSLVFLVRRVV
jgi:hypothetical protein